MHASASSAGQPRWPLLASSSSRSAAVNPSPPKEENDSEPPNLDIDELDSLSPSEISPASTQRTAKWLVSSPPQKPSPPTIKAGLPESETIYARLDRECRARCRILAKEYGWTTNEISSAMGSSGSTVSRTIRNKHKALDTVALDEQYVDKVKLKTVLDSKKDVERRKYRRKAKPIGRPRKRAKVSKAAPAEPETCENDELETSPSREASVAPPKKTLRPPPKRPVISSDGDESDEEVVQPELEDRPQVEELVAGPKAVLQTPNSQAISVKDKNVWPPIPVQAQIATKHDAVLAVPQDRVELKANINHASINSHPVAERETPKPALTNAPLAGPLLPPPGPIRTNPIVAGNIVYGPAPEVSEKKEPQQDKNNWSFVPAPAPVPDAPPAFAPSALPQAAGVEIPNTDGPAHLTKFLASLEIDLSRHLALFLANDITCVADLAQYCGFREANLTRRFNEMFFDPFHRADSEVRNLKRKRDEVDFEWEGGCDVGGLLRDDCKGLKQAEIYALIHGIGVLKRRRLEEQDAIPAISKY